MNDVLRFRAWHKPTKRMFDVYCFTDKHVFENTLDGVGTSPTNPANIEDCILEQCTGLKDKTGRLIYEGDIIQIHSRRFFLKVDDFNVLACVCSDFSDSFDWSYFVRNIWAEGREKTVEVIGNIHENPKLLEVKI